MASNPYTTEMVINGERNKGFENGPIKSRVGAFPDVFSMTNSRFKGTESRSEPRIRFRLAAGKSGYYWCVGLFVK